MALLNWLPAQFVKSSDGVGGFLREKHPAEFSESLLEADSFQGLRSSNSRPQAFRLSITRHALTTRAAIKTLWSSPSTVTFTGALEAK